MVFGEANLTLADVVCQAKKLVEDEVIRTLKAAVEEFLAAKRAVLPNLKPSVKTSSLRLPESMLAELKMLANTRDVPYQSLMKIFLAEKIREELNAG